MCESLRAWLGYRDAAAAALLGLQLFRIGPATAKLSAPSAAGTAPHSAGLCSERSASGLRHGPPSCSCVQARWVVAGSLAMLSEWHAGRLEAAAGGRCCTGSPGRCAIPFLTLHFQGPVRPERCNSRVWSCIRAAAPQLVPLVLAPWATCNPVPLLPIPGGSPATALAGCRPAAAARLSLGTQCSRCCRRPASRAGPLPASAATTSELSGGRVAAAAADRQAGGFCHT